MARARCFVCTCSLVCSVLVLAIARRAPPRFSSTALSVSRTCIRSWSRLLTLMEAATCTRCMAASNLAGAAAPVCSEPPEPPEPPNAPLAAQLCAGPGGIATGVARAPPRGPGFQYRCPVLPSNNDDPGDHGLTVPETVLTSVVTSGRLLLQGSNGPTTLAAVFRTWEHGSE